MMIGEVREEAIDGILGQSWLGRHDYLLDYRECRLVLDGIAPADGIKAAVRLRDDRPAVTVEVNRRHGEFVLDSGTAVAVLFEPPRGAANVAVSSNGGETFAERATAEIALAGARPRRLPAIRMDGCPDCPGLLPMNAFSRVYVSRRGSYAVLVP
jgi:hypothetical protein